MPNARQRNFRALQALEAVARHRSLTSAASELGVTQSAISHQIRHLTDDLGEKLFRRVGRSVELTPSGQRLAERLHAAFGQIDSSIDEVTGVGRGTLRFAVSGTFAMGWLVPRLEDFYTSFPTASLQLRMQASDPELSDQVADAFVTSYPDAAGFWSMRIVREFVLPVYSAEIGSGALSRLPLITTILTVGNIGGDWAQYCRFAQLPPAPMGRPWIETSHHFLALEMARCGLGIALVPDFLVEEDLARGRLRLFDTTRMPTEEDYHFCVKWARRSEAPLRGLETWLRSQIAAPASLAPA